MVIDKMQSIVILPSLIALLFDDMEKKLSFVLRVFGNNLSHTLFPFDGQFLTCLSSSISQDAVFDVGLFGFFRFSRW